MDQNSADEDDVLCNNLM